MLWCITSEYSIKSLFYLSVSVMCLYTMTKAGGTLVFSDITIPLAGPKVNGPVRSQVNKWARSRTSSSHCTYISSNSSPSLQPTQQSQTNAKNTEIQEPYKNYTRNQCQESYTETNKGWGGGGGVGRVGWGWGLGVGVGCCHIDQVGSWQCTSKSTLTSAEELLIGVKNCQGEACTSI